ncbi:MULTISPECIES: MoaD/ThiS family protein [unclassified Pedobacter]|jgi:molybdopterin synthase sulfur carrier subunit|uniref:MoaD/ThiS family protein n=1 Tax=Pedobacter TaxID=84567 RepID=UPI000B4B06A9|nr:MULTISPECIES: MoaD/ThiS family protein [unclassified Pedobacter]MCX2429487.1 MoaD/ThiS family protein [Pedobacter sp. GR22-10]MCX2586332.1 MoaD/ThiS family protein [Pedobacter sp. MR22-3]OWK70881.1 molybdopterin synthase sulfur carrier subunit [Pedobacter sp. AJM]
MKLEIISFGKISEFIRQQQIEISDVINTDQLKSYLETSFPQLAGMKYKLAINQNVIQSNQSLKNEDKVAIMPPFSGG